MFIAQICHDAVDGRDPTSRSYDSLTAMNSSILTPLFLDGMLGAPKTYCNKRSLTFITHHFLNLFWANSLNGTGKNRDMIGLY